MRREGHLPDRERTDTVAIRTARLAGVLVTVLFCACGAVVTPGDGGARDAARDAPVDAACITPRLIAPISTSWSLGGRPLLRVDSAAPRGTVVDFCPDRECVHLLASIPVGSAGTATPSPELGVGTAFWRARVVGPGCTSAMWELAVTPAPHTSTPGGMTWGSNVDFDGDGYSDTVLAASPAAAPAGAGSYGIYFVPGGRGGLDWTQTILLLQINPIGTNSIPNEVTRVGDVDGDGYGDVAATWTRPGSDDRGFVVLFGGPRLGLGGRVQWVQWGSGPQNQAFPIALAGAGDANGDGFGDIVMLDAQTSMIALFRGGPAGVQTTLPWSRTLTDVAFVRDGSPGVIAGLGDVTGDGLADVAIAGWVSPSLHQGAVVILPGTRGTPGPVLPVNYPFPTVVVGTNPQIVAVGDVNGDATLDLVMVLGDQALLLEGPQPGGVILPVPGPPWYPVAASDVDGDGITDVMFPFNDATGNVALCFGAAANPLSRTQVIAGPIAGLAGAVDFDNDGYADALFSPTSPFPSRLVISARYGSTAGLTSRGSDVPSNLVGEWGGPLLQRSPRTADLARTRSPNNFLAP